MMFLNVDEVRISISALLKNRFILESFQVIAQKPLIELVVYSIGSDLLNHERLWNSTSAKSRGPRSAPTILILIF